jgi:tRNA pseudouridine38-40 synthase
VAHLDLPRSLGRGPEPQQLKRALNALTCDGLVVTELEISDDHFHARFNPHRKTYAYHLYFGDRPHPMLQDRSHLVHGQQQHWGDAKRFWRALKGKHDFGSYCSSSNDTETTERNIVNTAFEELSSRHSVLRIQGKGFLQHMVRILAGTALGIAQGKVKFSDAMEALELGAGHRNKLGLTLPAKGLWLESTDYLEREDWQKT